MTTLEPTESRIGGGQTDAEVCEAHGLDVHDLALSLDDWARPVDEGDRALLGHCRGATLDVGCGPGRMGEHLAGLGHVVLGVDVVREAVDQTRERGVSAVRRNVFEPLPGEGQWDTVLLADGNIGIGGAPLSLLRRARELLAPAGRVVCDLSAPGTGLHRHHAHLVTDLRHSGSFPWARVGPEAIGSLATAAGLLLVHLDEHDGRWFAVLQR